MKIRAKYFALFREFADKEEEAFDFPENATVLTLMDEIISKYPRLKGERIFAAINNNLVNPSRTLHEGDNVAIFPVVGGG